MVDGRSRELMKHLKEGMEFMKTLIQESSVGVVFVGLSEGDL